MKKIYLIPFLLLIAIITYSQELPVAVNSKFTGEGSVFHNGKSKKIFADQLYYQSDSIIITKASLHLLLDGDKWYSIMQPGKYKIANILKASGVVPTSLEGQYFKDAIHHILSGKHDGGFSRTKIGAAYGGINNTRGGCDFLISPLNNLHTDTTNIEFKWNKVEGANKYNFKIMEFSRRKEVVYETEVNNTSYILNTTKFNWVNKQQYLWTIEPIEAESECDPSFNSFALYTPESTKAEINEIIKSINNDKGDLIYQLEVIDTLGKRGWYTK